MSSHSVHSMQHYIEFFQFFECQFRCGDHTQRINIPKLVFKGFMTISLNIYRTVSIMFLLRKALALI